MAVIFFFFSFLLFFPRNTYAFGLEKELNFSSETEKAVVLERDQVLKQEFISPRNNFGAVGIKFALFNRIGQGSLVFRACKAKEGCFYEHELNTGHLGNKDFYYFGFPKITYSKGKRYYLELENKTISKEAKVGVFYRGEDLVLKTLHEFSPTDLKDFQNFRDIVSDLIFKTYQAHQVNRPKSFAFLFSGFVFLALLIFIKKDKVFLDFFKKKNQPILMILLLIALGLRIHKIDFEFRDDAFRTVPAAYGFFKTGKFFKWDFLEDKLSSIPYPRAWPHSVLLALSFKIFGFSEISARLVSIIFGVFLIPVSYFIIKDIFKNKLIALAFASIFVFDPYLIDHARYVRMYGLFIPAFF